ncbi:TetR/AcrR family transcriptional regulator [Streptomyces sp. NRRL S-813]|uniref:TetR/AcrR family transcriptional regulator n=1 Tax=Streptomyces sp. NRRL S-813 TaxID=1463919 RepID=UPI0004BFCB02|nr:TetR/AcrR family transcriptional regulator [Streptomyces sp. NRRL S-813]
MGDRSPVGRRDALRNRKLLANTAREVFAEQGLDAPLDVIARRAGVGNATLYRHFPTRAALVDEVFRDALTETAAAGERARAAEDAWAGLTQYLRTVFAALAADRGTNDLMTTNLEGVTSLEAIHAHNRETIDELIRRGKEQGTIRPDLTTEDLLFTLAALGRAVPALTTIAPDAWLRPLTLLLDALRTNPATPPLTAPPLTSHQLGKVLLNLGPRKRR